MIPQINIGSKLDGKGFKKAETALDKLGVKGKKTARNLGLAFSVTAILAYSKASVRAFAADDKAANALTLTLRNLNLAFADPTVKSFIASLEEQYGIADDLLRPAYQKLLTTTSDYIKAQELLKVSLDLSAMSGKDVVTTSSDLAKAFSGNTRGLLKYGLGINKAELATLSFDQILEKITSVSFGQAEKAANSTSGSLARLSRAGDNAAESIGGDLITAFSALGGGNGDVASAISFIKSFSGAVGEALIFTGRFARNIGILASGNLFESFRDLDTATANDRIADTRRKTAAVTLADNTHLRALSSNFKVIKATSKATSAILDKNKKITASQIASAKAAKLKLATDKANLVLGKGEDVFDLDKIQNAAALASQAEQLGKATNAAQILGIANDTARLNVKRSMLELEDAIASGNVKQIELATAKLNRDVQILGALGGQEVKLRDIRTILESLKPKDLINLNNLNEALALLKKITDSPSTVKSPVTGSGSAGGGSSGDFIAPISAVGASIDAILEYADAATARANAMADLLDFQNAAALATLMKGALGSSVKSGSNPYGGQDRNMDTTINIYANTVSNPDELTNLIQDAVIRLNKRGDFTTTAGSL